MATAKRPINRNQRPTTRSYDAAAYRVQRTRLDPVGIRLGTDPVRAVATLGDEVLRLREQVRELRPLAELGAKVERRSQLPRDWRNFEA